MPWQGQPDGVRLCSLWLMPAARLSPRHPPPSASTPSPIPPPGSPPCDRNWFASGPISARSCRYRTPAAEVIAARLVHIGVPAHRTLDQAPVRDNQPLAAVFFGRNRVRQRRGSGEGFGRSAVQDRGWHSGRSGWIRLGQTSVLRTGWNTTKTPLRRVRKLASLTRRGIHFSAAIFLSAGAGRRRSARKMAAGK